MNNEMMARLEEVHYLSKDIEEKLGLVDQELAEMRKFEEAVTELDKTKEKEILASLGKGVYVKSEIKEDKLLIDVGRGVYVKKTTSQAKEIVEGQIKRLIEMRSGLVEQLSMLESEMREMVEAHGHEHNHEGQGHYHADGTYHEGSHDDED